ncbi:ligase-associated DNA damage response DEXH box helicase [Flavobacteriales bacterium]|jgi:ATP-dependent Lhr-like helicase|nr:ligase-associated DNA damage response DEXH box helicase [Flavobacteriales bacterium]
MSDFESWVTNWMNKKNWKPQKFQSDTWKAVLSGYSGLVNAPTGSGKTLSLLPPILWPNKDCSLKTNVFCIWITPLRSLSQQIRISMEEFIDDNNLNLTVGIRNGDTPQKIRNLQRKKLPHILITTPESLQLLISSKDWVKKFSSLQAVVVDEWHELIGSKRGVQTELCIAALQNLTSKISIWGISATIGNLKEAMSVLLGDFNKNEKRVLIKSNFKKKITVQSIAPKEIKQMPWRGHLGTNLIRYLTPVINKSQSTLIFTNTRSQCELWYQKILAEIPELAGNMAMHHGSISKEIRIWVEDSLRNNQLKVVVCTSSLDLGVDFHPVESIIQIGGPKGVARFIQRAGRSGHQPNKESKIYFLPTHAIELIECSALNKAVQQEYVEQRTPYILCFDVLIQFLISLAVSEGFYPNNVLNYIKKTHAFSLITLQEWEWVLKNITIGSNSLKAYNEYKKVDILESGLFKVNSRLIAMRHRLQIGTIVSDEQLQIKLINGKRIGVIEEWFISKLKKGEVFLFGGQFYKIFQIKNMEVLVKKSKSKKGKVVSWMGGRMSFSSYMSELLRNELYELNNPQSNKDISPLNYLAKIQFQISTIPKENEFLIESFETKEGFHTVFYPFEGRFVHEALSHLIAYRISLLKPVTFSLAYNDYGFELLSDEFLNIENVLDNNLWDESYLFEDLNQSINTSEMARRKFRDIAVISGLIFTGMPNKRKKNKDLQSGSQLLFDVFRDYEPENLLFKQSFSETFEYQLEEERLRKALIRIQKQKLIWKKISKPSPFSFPIITDRLRESLSSEQFDDRISKMLNNYS